jgi:hypothetical protein
VLSVAVPSPPIPELPETPNSFEELIALSQPQQVTALQRIGLEAKLKDGVVSAKKPHWTTWVKLKPDSKKLKKLVEDACQDRRVKNAETLAREQEAFEKARKKEKIERLRSIRAAQVKEVLLFLTSKDFTLLRDKIILNPVQLDPDSDTVKCEFTFNVAEVHPLMEALRLATDSKASNHHGPRDEEEEKKTLPIKVCLSFGVFDHPLLICSNCVVLG